MENASALGARLRRARHLANLTQQEVADAIHVNRATYTHYETGKIEVSAARLQDIASVLGVDMASLLGQPDTADDRPSRHKESLSLMDATTLESLLESLHELASTVKMHKELEAERIAADRERARLVDAVKAQAEADRASAEKELAHANVLAQENIRKAIQLAEFPHSSSLPDESEAAETSYGR